MVKGETPIRRVPRQDDGLKQLFIDLYREQQSYITILSRKGILSFYCPILPDGFQFLQLLNLWNLWIDRVWELKNKTPKQPIPLFPLQFYGQLFHLLVDLVTKRSCGTLAIHDFSKGLLLS